MSTVFGLVTNNCALVASDGRTLFYHNVNSEDFDKTFEIQKGDIKFIGAFAGAVSFEGKTIGTHLFEILNHCTAISFADTLEYLVIKLNERLRNIAPNEIAIEFRRVDLMLISSYSGALSDLKIYNVRYAPNDDNTDIIITARYSTPNDNAAEGFLYWSIFGDDQARQAIDTALNGCGLRVAKNEPSLRYICEPLIKLGISNATVNHLGNASCGGSIYVRSIT